ncbi:MAG: 16S rRNA (guanine(527)-N(7))-methyltransferase RsmG [Caldilineaceae bacterium SB0661_bin_34]|nr:16S rRNA (guanine(527)-N(7))-methyltransferase RsmG [Caldilineaceae bacterium SB0661_bin_34]
MTNTKPDVSFRQAVRRLLADRARAMGLPLDDRQLERFALFADCLRDGNTRINLTAITDVEGIVLKHFLDSMAVWPALSRELEDLRDGNRLAVLDVGTGAGLPGIALAILDPDIQLTLMDGTLRKVDFLTAACKTLDMTEVAVVHGRAEELGRQPAFREQFPVVVARGLAPLPTLLEYLVPLTGVGGLCLAYKGPNLPVELQAARPALQALRVDVERVIPVQVPGLDATRRVAVFRKTRTTATKYPRGQGQPRRRPLQA